MIRIRFYAFVIPLLLGLAACNDGGSPNARVVIAELGSITDARFGGDGWNLDGVNMTETVAKLLEPANFGLNGTSRTAIRITSTAPNQGDVTLALLSAFDIFFIGFLNDASPNAFTADELTAFSDWVTGGGILIVTCDSDGYDAVCESFGYPQTGPALQPTVPAAAGVGHPLFDGAFGPVTEIGMFPIFGSFPMPVGATVLGEDSTVQPAANATILELELGAGRVIFLSDVDMISNLTLSPGTGMATENDRFMGNLFDYATGLI